MKNHLKKTLCLMNNRNHIVIADPSAIMREGISAVLNKLTGVKIDIAEIESFESFQNLNEQLSELKPDVLIINPIYIGMRSVQQIKSETGLKNIKTIALIIDNIPQILVKSFDASININDTPNNIKNVIATLAKDQLSPKLELSAREKEVVVEVVKGLTGKQIADKLCLSTHTVMTHRRNIASKLQIHSSAGLTIYAIVNKLVDINDVKETINQPQEY